MVILPQKLAIGTLSSPKELCSSHSYLDPTLGLKWSMAIDLVDPTPASIHLHKSCTIHWWWFGWVSLGTADYLLTCWVWFGGFHKWGYPQTGLLWKLPSINGWFGGTPISGNLHLWLPQTWLQDPSFCRQEETKSPLRNTEFRGIARFQSNLGEAVPSRDGWISISSNWSIEESLEVKLPTIWTDGKAEVGRVRREEKKWEDQRGERERGKKMQVREKVGKSRLTVFSNDLRLQRVEELAEAAGAEPCRQMRDEKLHAVQLKVYKTHHSQTTFGSWDVEKVHSVVARSTFGSQK